MADMGYNTKNFWNDFDELKGNIGIYGGDITIKEFINDLIHRINNNINGNNTIANAIV